MLAAAIKEGSTKLKARPRLPRSHLIVLVLLPDHKTIVPVYGNHALKNGILEKIKEGDNFYQIDSWRHAISEADFLIDSVMLEVFESSSITNATKTNYAITTMSTFEPPRSLRALERIEVVLRESLSTYKQSDTLNHLRVSKCNDHMVALVGDNREHFIDEGGQVLELNLHFIRIIEKKKDLQFNHFDFPPFYPRQALDIYMVDHIINTIWTQEKIREGLLTTVGKQVITYILKCLNRHVKVLNACCCILYQLCTLTLTIYKLQKM